METVSITRCQSKFIKFDRLVRVTKVSKTLSFVIFEKFDSNFIPANSLSIISNTILRTMLA